MSTLVGPRLDRVLMPGSIAVVGASRDHSKLGGKVLANLEKGFTGDLHAVHPRAGTVAVTGQASWVSDLANLPPAVDLVVLAVPARTVVDLVCADAIPPDTGGVVVLADESGDAVARRRFDDVLGEFAARTGVRVLGPNSSGFRAYGSRLFVTFAGDVDGRVVDRRSEGEVALRVSLVSPSGAMMAYLGGTLLSQRGVELDYVIDTGNEVDIDAAECLGFLARRGARRVGLVLEGTRDWRRFRDQVSLAAADGVDVVALQVGRSTAGRAISASHTGAVTGSAGAFRAVLDEAGGTAAVDDADFLDALTVSRDAVRGRSRSVLLGSFSGGMNALLADQLADSGIHVPALAELLPAGVPAGLGSVSNPQDFGPGALRDVAPIRDLMRCAALAPSLGATVVFTGHVTRMAGVGDDVMGVIADGARELEHPVIVVGKRPQGWQAAELPNLLVVDEPRSAARALAHAFGPVLSSTTAPSSAPSEQTLPWPSAARLLAEAGVAVPATRVVATAEEAASAARELGLPVVMKSDAPGLLHRARHGLVAVGVPDEGAVVRTFERLAARVRDLGMAEAAVLVQAMVPADAELFIGASYDDAFGPTVTLALGGSDVEDSRRSRFQLLVPVAGERCARALTALGLGADAALVDTVTRVCGLGLQLAGATVVEINPLRVSSRHPGGVAVDCVILQDPKPEGDDPWTNH